MWSRDGLKSGSTMIYRSTPHLFVYQPCEDDDDPSMMMTSSSTRTVAPTADALRMMQDELTDGGEDTEPSDSGYAASSSGSATATTPEAIYYSAMELSSSRKEKDAIRRLSFIKYADGSSAGGGADVYSTSGSSSDRSSVSDVDAHPVINQKQQLQQQQMLTELELLRVETFFRGNQTQIFVGKSLANL